MADNVVKLFGLDFVKKTGVDMLVRKGKGKYMQVVINGKDGNPKRFLMTELAENERFIGEESEQQMDW